MQAGTLRHRVLIERPVPGSDAYGQGDPTWEAVGTVWAFVRPMRAGEMVRAGQPGMETTYVVTMRYVEGMTADRRLTWEGRVLYLSSVIDVNGRHEALELVGHEREPTSG